MRYKRFAGVRRRKGAEYVAVTAITLLIATLAVIAACTDVAAPRLGPTDPQFTLYDSDDCPPCREMTQAEKDEMSAALMMFTDVTNPECILARNHALGMLESGSGVPWMVRTDGIPPAGGWRPNDRMTFVNNGLFGDSGSQLFMTTLHEVHHDLGVGNAPDGSNDYEAESYAQACYQP